MQAVKIHPLERSARSRRVRVLVLRRRPVRSQASGSDLLLAATDNRTIDPSAALDFNRILYYKMLITQGWLMVFRNAFRLRELMRADDIVLAPGVYDGITARLTEQAG